MLANAILLTASGLFLGTTYFIKKQKLYKDIFDELRNAKSFHMDYVEDVTHLPLDKYVMLFGPAHSFNQQIFIAFPLNFVIEI